MLLMIRTRANFIKCGYKEAIEEGLKEEYLYGGRYLWKVMMEQFPNQFSGAYPSTDEARTAALKDFKPTKQDLEEAWAKENAPILLKQLETLVTELPLSQGPVTHHSWICNHLGCRLSRDYPIT